MLANQKMLPMSHYACTLMIKQAFFCVEKHKNISADHTGGPRCGTSSVPQPKGKTE